MKKLLLIIFLISSVTVHALEDTDRLLEIFPLYLDPEIESYFELMDKVRQQGYLDSAEFLGDNFYNVFDRKNDTLDFLLTLQHINDLDFQKQVESILPYFDSLFEKNEKLFNNSDTLRLLLKSDYYYCQGTISNDISEVNKALDSLYECYKKYDLAGRKIIAKFYMSGITLNAAHDNLEKAFILLDVLKPLVDSLYGEYDINTCLYYYALSICQGQRGEHTAAIESAKKALEIFEQLDLNPHMIRNSIEHQMAFSNKELGNYSKAEEQYLNLIKYYKTYFKNKKNNNQLVRSLNNLAVVYYTTGEFSKIEPILKESLEIQMQENPKGKVVGALYINLGNLNSKLGQYDKAIDYYSKALEVFQNLFEPNHVYFSKIYNNLGYTLMSTGQYKQARENLQKAVEIRENIHGPDHPEVATVLHNLSMVNLKLGLNDQVEPLLVRAMTINEKALGKDHVALAKNQEALAMFYFDLDREQSKAESLVVDSYRIRKKALSKYHPDLANTMKRLTHLYLVQGNETEAYRYLSEMLNTRQEIAQYIFSFSAESQKLTWVKNNPVLSNLLISYAQQEQASDKFTRLALEMVLEGKSIISSFVQNDKNLLYCSDDTTLKNLHREYISVCKNIAQLAMENSAKISRDSLQNLIQAKDNLETNLNRLCADLLAPEFKQSVDLDLLSGRLKKDELLLEFIKYQPYSFDHFDQKLDSVDNRYLVFTLNAEKEISLHDLGRETAIDSLVLSLREMIEQKNSLIYSPAGQTCELQFKQISAEFYHKIFDPIEKQLTGIDNIYLATDGSLGLVPFEILCRSENDNYLIDDYNFFYINSGRDLLEFDDTKNENRSLVIFANPSTPRLSSPLMGGNTYSETNPLSNSGECLVNRDFGILPFAQKEALKISELGFKHDYKVDLFLNDQATEEKLKNLDQSPSILHFATHGYYCPTDDSLVDVINMTLNSGLILASGAEHRIYLSDEVSSEDDGILTSLEVADLNLHRTDLVNLSACKTGIGDIISGEGVYGLRRAFQNAGAKSLMLSMWNIPDDLSYKVMSEFYSRWLDGAPKSEALRQAMLSAKEACQKTYGNTHPVLWNGYILIGNPR